MICRRLQMNLRVFLVLADEKDLLVQCLQICLHVNKIKVKNCVVSILSSSFDTLLFKNHFV